ncbi:MAG TPA: homocysteine S-methyltransferase family protein, partial [Thermomicrobiales bacterium]|nr:homocysteine S-methyltransferase family protein [Thermomicrobiales bacterium]
MASSRPLAERLAVGRPLLLDAAMGTELDRRGVRTTLPLWSAIGLTAAPDVVWSIHVDNLVAGAAIITTNTFRTTRRVFAKAGRDPEEGPRLNAVAVGLARAARDEADRQ